MASSNTEIVNLALSHLAHNKTISDLETESSEEAKNGRRFYDTAVKKVAESAPWPFLTRIAALGLVEEEPNTEWGYSYRYPANCVRLVRVLSGVRNDDRQTRSPYRIISDTTGKLILSDEQDLQMEYIVNASDPTIFSAGFTFAVSFYLAHLMGPTISKGDQFGLAEKALTMYEYEVARASNEAFNEQQDEEQVDAESVRGRD